MVRKSQHPRIDVYKRQVTGGGAIVKAVSKADDVVDVVKTANKVDNVVDTTKTAKKIHGNSLKTTKETIGYALRKTDTGEIMKYGETTRGIKRYTNKFYRENNVFMDPLARGTKYDMQMCIRDRGNGVQISYLYDELGRMTRKAGGFSWAEWTYNKAGQVSGILDLSLIHIFNRKKQ